MGRNLSEFGIHPEGRVYRNLSVEELVAHALRRGEGRLSNSRALVVDTRPRTSRSAMDKFIVDTTDVHDKINWSDVNHSISESTFDGLYQKIAQHLSDLPELFVFDGFVGVTPEYKLPIRVVTENAYQALFCRHVFINPTEEELATHVPEFTVLAAPGCKADPTEDIGVRLQAAVVLNLKEKLAVIHATGYCGEIKKTVFTYLNYLLPDMDIFPMHCAANVGMDGKSALFFGLSGTGKTTLSADPNRWLVGDDEHGWSETGICNFEGGCYAKCYGLTKENEPQIFHAIKDGAVVENVVLTEDGEIDFADKTITENTRAAYPLTHIPNSVPAGHAPHPETIIFLTADALAVMPPVAKLDEESALYYFLSGYTSKLAGAEGTIIEPEITFSACFGAPFMPRPPIVYAQLLRRYMREHKSRVYLINTGWSGGPYGVGKRISIKDTRKIVTAVLNGEIDAGGYRRNEAFDLDVPFEVPGVDPRILTPRDLWEDPNAYDENARKLANLFAENFRRKFKGVSEEIVMAGPGLLI